MDGMNHPQNGRFKSGFPTYIYLMVQNLEISGWFSTIEPYFVLICFDVCNFIKLKKTSGLYTWSCAFLPKVDAGRIWESWRLYFLAPYHVLQLDIQVGSKVDIPIYRWFEICGHGWDSPTPNHHPSDVTTNYLRSFFIWGVSIRGKG